MRSSNHIAHFEKISDDYDRMASLGRSDNLKKHLHRLLSQYSRIRVLDIGTGTGNFAEIVIANGCQVWGLDHNEKMLELAKAKGLRPLLGDISTVAKFEEAFDLISARQVFQYTGFEKLVTAASDIRKALSAGGHVVLHHMTAPSDDTRRKLKACMGTPGNPHPFIAHEDFLEVFSGVGFEVLEEWVHVSRISEKLDDFALYRNISKTEAAARFNVLSQESVFDVRQIEDAVVYNRYYSAIRLRAPK